MSTDGAAPDADSRMRAEVARQSARLREQLAQLAGAPPPDGDPATLQQVSVAATALRDALAEVPPALRTLLTGAELGFMPGPGLDAFAPRHAQEWHKELGSLAEGAQAVLQWQGADGGARRRDWLIRGYIRGFAHQWRQAGRGEPDVDSEHSEFIAFATPWLREAGVTGDLARRCRAALGRGWRLAAD